MALTQKTRIMATSIVLCSTVSLHTVAKAQESNSNRQNSGENTPLSSGNDGIADIIVHGQRRAVGESAQKVPISITAIGAQALKSSNSINIADIGSLAPNVQTTVVGTFPAFPNFSIRGVGTTASIRSIDPPINIIQDGMVLAYQAGAVVSTFDLESIEILRGPQGVLFGRNSSGGTIALQTRRPSEDFGFQMDLSYGNFNELNANASIEGALGSPNLLAKIAVLYRSNTGTIKNTNDGIFVPAPGNPTGARSSHPTDNIGDVDELIIKPTFLVKVSDAARLTLFTQYQRYNDDGSSVRNFATPAGQPAT